MLEYQASRDLSSKLSPGLEVMNMKKPKPKQWLPKGGVSIPASKQDEETEPVEWLTPKLYKPRHKKRGTKKK
jgi:hypothetical protein